MKAGIATRTKTQPYRFIAALLLALACGLSSAPVAQAASVPANGLPTGAAAATIDLTSDEGVRMARAEWRYRDARIVETEFRSPGADQRPSGPPNRAYDLTPHAGGADYDDSQWETIPAATLAARRSAGRIAFNWYRIKVTIPERIGDYDPTGATVVFDITVDDYAEVWVNGQLPRELGQAGGSLIAGFNVPNRLVVGRDVRPGQQIQLAVMGINGPLSDPPPNYIWVRAAKLEFYAPEPRGGVPVVARSEIVRVDPAINEIVPQDARVERLATGFQFTEGPVWVRAGNSGYLLFSDPNANTIYKWTPADGQVSVFRAQSGYAGADVAEYRQPGSNGLTLDREGRLTINEHGNRRITRLERDGSLTVLTDRYDGRRLNSPNDLVYRSDGSLYFTDPPFGLPRVHDDPRRELPFTGIYRFHRGRTQLLSTDLTGPNGIAFSPDERFLYVANWDTSRKVVMRYEVRRDGTLRNGRVFFDMTNAPGEEALDGLKVDSRGNLYVSGPGGLWIISAAGRHLGTIRTPELPANFAWGDTDGRTLYLTARTGLYRIRLNIPGVRP